MGTERTSVELVIEAQNRSAAAIASAIQDQKRLGDEVKRAQQAMDGSAESNVRLGRAVIAQREATARLNSELSKLHQTNTAVTGSQSALGQTVSDVTGQISSQAGSVGRLAASFGPIGIAVGAAVGALAAFGGAAVTAANKIGDYQEKQDILAEQTGLTVQEIGGLTVAASNIGREFDSIQPSLSIFVRNVGEAADGSKTAMEAFSRLGVSVKDQDGKIRPTGELLKEVAVRLNALPDPAQRARDAFDLFGRGAASMLPILAQDLTAAEALAQKLGITLSPAMQKVARDADAAGDKFKLAFMGAMNQLIGTLAPAGTAILTFATNAIEQLRKLADFINEHTLGAFRDLKETADEMQGTRAGQVDVGSISVKRLMPGGELEKMNEQQRALVKQAQEQLLTLQKQIPLLDYQRQIGAITAKQEVDKLEALKGQALTTKELLIINEKIAQLNRSMPRTQGIGPSSDAYFKYRHQLHPFSESETGEAPTFQEIQGAGEMVEPKVDFKELSNEAVKFLDHFENFPELLQMSADAQGHVNETVLGFVGTLQDLQLTALEMGRLLAHQVTGAFTEMVRGFISGTDRAGDAFKKLVLEMISTIATQAAIGLGLTIFKTVASVAAGPAMGNPFMTAQAGGVWHPYRLQAGAVMNGIRGRDTVHAMIGQDEAVLDHTLTDDLRSYLRASNGPGGRPAPRGGDSYTFHFNVTGSLADERSLRALVDEKLAPAVTRAQQRNSMRSGG